MFYEVFKDHVIDRVAGDVALSEAFRQRACDGARARFTSDESAYCYCMCWQYMHFESLCTVLSEGYLDGFRFPLVIDYGCGPGTVASALAERRIETLGHGPLSLRYVGIDLYASMRRIAGAFLRDPRLFAGAEYIEASDVGIRVTDYIDGRPDCILFALSYFLHQPELPPTIVDVIADQIVSTLQSCTLPAWLLVQDVNFRDWPNYRRLQLLLNQRGYVTGGTEKTCTQPRRRAWFNGEIFSDPTGTENVRYQFGPVRHLP